VTITLNNILLADDHPIVRQGVEMLLSSRLENTRFFHAKTLAETLEVLDRVKFDLLFLDLFFPDGNSMGIIDKIIKKYPSLRIVVFSGMEDDVYALPVFRAGAHGYINKLSSPEVLEKAIDRVLSGKPCFSKALMAKLEQSTGANPLDSLSDRELEIVKLLASGAGNLEICNALSLQKSTVSTFIKRIKEKLKTESTNQITELYNTYKYTVGR